MSAGLTPNVPGIIPYLPEEVDEFETLIAWVKSKQLSDEEFTGKRLVRGVYGQRQPDRQMVRIKIPLGRLDGPKLEALAQVIEQFAPLAKGHFTTRENLQLHHVPLDATPAIMRILGPAGLTTREACGNTVRNVTGCALAGVCPDEVFDATPYAAAYVRYFVRREFTKMPRKFKTAFVGCREDHAVVRIHDLGFVGLLRQVAGSPVRGFRIVVGGGTSIEPVLAAELYDFVPADDGSYLRVAEAVLRVFNRSDELRKNRMRARIKVLIKRIGIDAFRQEVEKELGEPWTAKPIDVRRLGEGLPPEGEPPRTNGGDGRDGGGGDGFAEWLRTNVVPQKQAGYHAAFVAIPVGDVTAAQCRGLAEIARAHGTGEVRVTFDQNVVIRWVPAGGGALHAVWSALGRIGLAAAGARRVIDVVSCPGTDSCKLGITSSMGLNRAVRAILEKHPDLALDPLIEQMQIRISGCPNGCGQHHLGDLGFHGAAAKGDQKMMLPAYEAFVGGFYKGSNVRYGLRLRGRIPAKRLPAALIDFLEYYRRERRVGEVFAAFVDRVGREPFEALIERLSDAPAFEPAHPECYQDWERTALYKVERGEGECAM
jgi:sulfite reductase (ferredoxin)